MSSAVRGPISFVIASALTSMACVGAPPPPPSADESSSSSSSVSTSSTAGLMPMTTAPVDNTSGTAGAVLTDTETTMMVDPTTGSTGSSTESGDQACAADPPGSGECPAICANGCSDGICELDCTGANTCDGVSTMIVCPDGWPCRVLCVGPQACKDASIVCPTDHACDIRCEDVQACSQANVTCGGGSCTVTCDLHDQACDNLGFSCGSADSHVLCNVDQSGPIAVTPTRDSSCACEAERAC